MRGAPGNRRPYRDLVGLLSPVPGALAVLGGGPSHSALVLVQLGSLLFLSFPFAFAYALLRQRLFGLRFMLRQGLQYAFARRVLFSAVPALGALLVLDLLQHGDAPLVAVLRARGSIYAVLAALALVAQSRRERWLTALDRRFFRERYDAKRLLREVAEEARKARRVDDVAGRVVTAIEATLHPQLVAPLARDAGESAFRALAVAPAGQAAPALFSHDKLLGLLRLLGRPLELAGTQAGLARQSLGRRSRGCARRDSTS